MRARIPTVTCAASARARPAKKRLPCRSRPWEACPSWGQKPLHPERAELVGRYALQIHWSDGHSSGIYAFPYLRRLCPCPACTALVKLPKPTQANELDITAALRRHVPPAIQASSPAKPALPIDLWIAMIEVPSAINRIPSYRKLRGAPTQRQFRRAYHGELDCSDCCLPRELILIVGFCAAAQDGSRPITRPAARGE